MDSKERKSILIVTLSNIGDVILTTPVISSLRSKFPEARFTVVAGPKAASLLEGSRQLDRVLVYDKEAGFSHKLKLIRSLREEFYDYVVDLRNSAIPFLVRANRRSPIFRRYREKKARERHLEVLRWMKLFVSESIPFDFFSEKDKASLIQKLEGRGISLSGTYLVVSPGAGSEMKRWKIEGFSKALSELLERFSLQVFVAGDQQEVPLGERLSGINPHRVINLTGQIELRELAALISGAKLVLTNDSACMHLAYELRRPVVAIFGTTDHERYGRENEIWRIVRGPSLGQIPAERVFDACSELLAGTPEP